MRVRTKILGKQRRTRAPGRRRGRRLGAGRRRTGMLLFLHCFCFCAETLFLLLFVILKNLNFF